MPARNDTVTVVTIECTVCGSKALLYQWPHKYEGIWECTNKNCGASDSCTHEERRIETTEDWPTGPLDNPREYQIYVCNLCDCAIPLDEADPAIDRAEAIADSQIMEALGK